MAERLSLRDYQRELVNRLKEAGAGRMASKLGMQVGGETWLVDLADAGEVIPVPPVTTVPLTKPWFKGVANVRGNLFSVVDFPAFLGVGAVAVGEQSRLLLIGDRFRTAAALLIDRSLGLRNADQLKPRARAEAEAGGDTPAWLRGEFEDNEGRSWKELDLPQLVRHADFLSVSA
jgi:twitching motility protein PilI